MIRLPRRHGFAILIAIAMLALVSAAIVVLTRQMGYDITRTRLAVTDTQLRQLLIAGAQDAVERSHQWGKPVSASEWQIDLPQPLKDGGAALSLQSRPISATVVEVRVDTRIDDRKASQLLHFARSANGWSVTDAELGR